MPLVLSEIIRYNASDKLLVLNHGLTVVLVRPGGMIDGEKIFSPIRAFLPWPRFVAQHPEENVAEGFRRCFLSDSNGPVSHLYCR